MQRRFRASAVLALFLAACWPEENSPGVSEPVVAPVPIEAVASRALTPVTAMIDGAKQPWIELAPDRYALVPTGTFVDPSPLLDQFQKAGYSLSVSGDVVEIAGDEGQRGEILLPPSGWLVLVIDDVGFNRTRVERMLDWNVPIVFSVLPGRPNSRRLIETIANRGRELFLHQPMEPHGYPEVDPGPSVLLLSQDVDRWRAILTENLALVPGAIGVNNHMGSRFTESATATATVAGFLIERNLFVLDSLTSGSSRLYSACRAVGGHCSRRDVFLDDELTEAAIDRQIDAALALAARRGLAIAIGHPGPLTVERLENRLAEIDRRGIKFVSYAWAQRWLDKKGAF